MLFPCPDCGNKIRMFAQACPSCGRKLQFHENGITWLASIAVTASTLAFLAWLLYRAAASMQMPPLPGLVTIGLL